MQNKIYIFLGIVALFISSCHQSKIEKLKDYSAYLADAENGLIKEKRVAGVYYRIKLLPAQYLTLLSAEESGGSAIKRDSLLKEYSNSLTFLVTIGPDSIETYELTRVGINTYDEYAERIEELAFGLEDNFLIETKNGSMNPTIVQMENVNAPSKSRDFVVVFPRNMNGKDVLKEGFSLTYEDELLNTGTSKFLFDKNAVRYIPEI